MHQEALTSELKKLWPRIKNFQDHRATYKDYVDLYFILREKRCSLNRIIHTAKKVYGDEFGVRLFLEQLVYLEDVRETAIRFLKKPVNKAEIEKFFRQEIKKMKL